MKNEQSAGIVFFRKIENRIEFLLLHYPSGHWDLVKGHVESNETAKETAKRESKEETGITDVKFIDGFEEEIEYYFRYDNQNIHKKVTFFLSETKQDRITLSNDSTNSMLSLISLTAP